MASVSFNSNYTSNLMTTGSKRTSISRRGKVGLALLGAASRVQQAHAAIQKPTERKLSTLCSSSFHHSPNPIGYVLFYLLLFLSSNHFFRLHNIIKCFFI
jgi:hypothetical protein